MKNIFLYLVVLLLFSCSKESFIKNEICENNFSADELKCIELITKGNKVSLNNAKEIALSFINSTGKTRSVNRSIDDIHVFIADNKTETKSGKSFTDTVMYVVNFSDNMGYALVSSDNRTTNIFGYSTEGNLSLDDLNPGQKIVFESIQSMYYLQIEKSNKLLDSLSETILKKLNNVDQNSINKGLTNTKSQIPGFEVKAGKWYDLPDTEVQLCNTEWSQDSPFNSYCFTKEGKQAVAGCVPIAIAQILVYHKSYPAGKNWLSIEKAGSTNATTEEDDLAAKLIQEVGDAVNTSYGESESPTNTSKALKFFGNGFKFYKNSQWFFWPEYIDYNVGEILYSIGNYISPVYIRGENNKGGRHAWVLSGMLMRERINQLLYYGKVVSETKEPLNLIYHNFGWGSGHNGYFATTEEVKFPVGTEIIPSLKQK